MQFLTTKSSTLSDKLSEILLSVDVILPEVLIASLVVLIIILDLIFFNRSRKVVPFVSVIGLVIISAFVIQDINTVEKQGFFESVVVTPLNSVLKLVFILSTIIAIWFNESSFYKKSPAEKNGEFYILLLSVVIGLNLMIMSRNLLVLFLGLEIVGLTSYALTIFKFNLKSKEASVKYLLYGIFASGLMLYGMSWLYGFNEGLSYHLSFSGGMPVLLGVAFILFTVGALFKISGFPFHIWVPDVYEGAPFPIVAFLSIAPKIAGIAVLMIILQNAFPGINLMLIGNLTFEKFLAVISILTICVGNFAALRQTNVKRMLGYSSIAHAGFLLIPLFTIDNGGVESLYYYILTYLFINFAAFILVYKVVSISGSELISDMAGIGRKSPYLGVFITIAMLALIGLPPTSGFLAKVYVFSSLWEEWSVSGHSILMVLFVVGLVNTVVSLFYYLKIPFQMFFKPNKSEGYLKVNVVDQIIIAIIVMMIILQFIFAEYFIEFIHQTNILSQSKL